MVKVKNISPHDVCITHDALAVNGQRRKTRHILKPGCTISVLLCHSLMYLVEMGQISLVDGGEILSIPGGLRYKKPLPLPPLRSLDDPWVS